ncbi:hypothetical protein HPP92_022125 [Vanilla planifolia]|uniref:Uncharacterized protein n=1 Tax=Vanilla planifolia TaxID=51239 RepID=A0A835UD83_VANPL|nr:hypothetical protein HPP92_022125 [Vanilla planifolia]
MVACGAVRKLLSLINVDGTSSTKEKALRMLKMHGHSWKQSPCFPYELRANPKLLFLFPYHKKAVYQQLSFNLH